MGLLDILNSIGSAASDPRARPAPAGPATSQAGSQGMSPMAKAMLAQALSTAVVGAPETVKQGIDAFVRRTGADELMVTAQIFDHRARVRSFEILADVRGELSKAA